jgi:uncharacterized membrane protein YbhN (UPF0104 family)
MAARVLGWSLTIWAVSIAGLWATIEMFVSGASVVEPTFMMVALAFGVAIPSSPGFVGVYQLVGQQALVAAFPARYSLSAALSIALAANVFDLALPSLLGAIGLAQLGLSPKDIRRAAAPASDPPILMTAPADR